jgi:Protein of unknown function (DUF2927).
MGLPNDYDGSKLFTFDDLAGVKADAKDWKLFRALYSKDIAPGDDVEDVLRIYEDIKDSDFTPNQ